MKGEFTDVQGYQVPLFFYGTAWKEDNTQNLTEMALESGFLAIDTANQRRHYYEKGAGLAVKSYLVDILPPINGKGF